MISALLIEVDDLSIDIIIIYIVINLNIINIFNIICFYSSDMNDNE